MKFIHKISKITSYIVQICLLIFALASNSLWGEVYRTNRPARNAKEFEQLIKEYTELEHKNEKEATKRTAKIKIKELFKRIKAEQMFGCGVFIPKSGPGTLYLSQKHKGDSPTNHNPASGGHPFNTDFKDHTERQLALYLAAEALRSVGPIGKATNPKATVTNGIINPQEEVKGEFYIYTTDAPCVDAVPNNNNFSCIEYYKILKEIFPNCKFHIYFSEITLNGSFFSKNEEYMNKFVNCIEKNINNTTHILNTLDEEKKTEIRKKTLSLKITKKVLESMGDDFLKDPNNWDIIQNVIQAQCNNPKSQLHQVLEQKKWKKIKNNIKSIKNTDKKSEDISKNVNNFFIEYKSYIYQYFQTDTTYVKNFIEFIKTQQKKLPVDKKEEILNDISEYNKISAGTQTQKEEKNSENIQNFIDNKLNNYLTPEQKEAIFKEVFSIDRFTYDLIPPKEDDMKK